MHLPGGLRLRALPVVTLVAFLTALTSLVVALALGVRVRRRGAWRTASPAAPRNADGVARVVDIAPYLARRELVEGAIAIAALARTGAIARHSERDRRSMPVPVVDLASRRRAEVVARPSVAPPPAAPALPGITVARVARITRQGSFEHLA